MSSRLLLTFIFLLTAAGAAAIEPGYDDADSVAARIIASGPHPIEGIWQFPADGSLMAIERRRDPSGSTVYRLVVVRSADRTVRPGTLIGLATPAGNGSTFDARISTGSDREQGRLSRGRFTIRLEDEASRLAFSKARSEYYLDLTRLLPYMFRRTIRHRQPTSAPAQICVKKVPQPAVPASPTYL